MRLCGSNVRFMLPIIVTASGPSSCSRYCTKWKHSVTCECTAGMVSTTFILELCRLLYWIWQWAENILYATVTLKIRISSRLFKRSCKPSCQTQTFIFPTPIPCSPEQVPAQLIMMIRLLLQKTPPPVYMHRWRWMCESPVKDSQKVMYAHFSLMNKWTNQLERGDVLKLSHPYRIQFMGCWKKVVQLLAKGSND